MGGYVITLHDSRAALEALSLDGQEVGRGGLTESSSLVTESSLLL